jgi:hypothetical protein
MVARKKAQKLGDSCVARTGASTARALDALDSFANRLAVRRILRLCVAPLTKKHRVVWSEDIDLSLF